MKEKTTMINSRIQLVGISRLRMGNDGKGIRTLVVTYGCPLKCEYCINSMSWSSNFTPKEMTAEELYEALKIDNLYFQSTGGGLTFGGGEPLLQADFIRDFVDNYCDKWSIAFETSLNVTTENLLKVIDIADYFYVDIKSLDEEIYRSYTGKSNSIVIENLKVLLTKTPDKFTVRIPLIPKYNTMDDCYKTEALLREMGVRNTSIFEYIVQE